ncbi:MAG TPA: redoxin domain-containing protein [Ktedonobacterales bacterium]|nr:redoxin domain-containing protein [Ktedonobacterales bacterium]
MTTSAHTPAAFGIPSSTSRGLPTFTLPDTSGALRRLWDYKQRHPVMVFVPHSPECAGCRAWLRDLRANRAPLDELGAAVLIIVRAPRENARVLQASLDLPFMVLVDADGEVASRYTARDAAALYLGDRYLQCIGRWIVAGGQHALPAPDDLLGTLAFAEQEDCGCGLPAWPEEALE